MRWPDRDGRGQSAYAPHDLHDLLRGGVLGQVGLADHADEGVTVDDREAFHLVLGHGANQLVDAVVGADGDRLALRQFPGRG